MKLKLFVHVAYRELFQKIEIGHCAGDLKTISKIATFRLEYEYDFLNIVFVFLIIKFHTKLVNWSATGSSERSGHVTGLDSYAITCSNCYLKITAVLLLTTCCLVTLKSNVWSNNVFATSLFLLSSLFSTTFCFHVSKADLKTRKDMFSRKWNPFPERGRTVRGKPLATCFISVKRHAYGIFFYFLLPLVKNLNIQTCKGTSYHKLRKGFLKFDMAISINIFNHQCLQTFKRIRNWGEHGIISIGNQMAANYVAMAIL